MADIGAEVTVDSETVFEGKLIQVRKETVQLPDGGTTVREIVAHSEVIAALPTLPDGRIVMVRQFRKPAERVMLEIPAGGIDGDESPEDAVRREMVEETGYRVGRVEHLTSFYTSPGFTTELMHLYRATELEPGEPTEETDQIEVVLVPRDEAVARIRSGELQDAKTILAILGYC
jgi:ADP-ribose pyrophosphatase